MSISVGLFLMTRKGYCTLRSLKRYASEITFVCAARDAAIQDDAFDDIRTLSAEMGIPFFERGETCPPCTCALAIGWRWLIHGVERLVVIHDSLLPKYRGFAPLVASLVNGEPRIGVTALIASEQYDRGDILFQSSRPVTYPIKISDAIELVSECYAEVAGEVLESVRHGGDLHGVPQDEEAATYSLWRDADDYRIRWTWPSEKIARFVDAVGYPYTGAVCEADGVTYVIEAAHAVPDVFVEDRPTHIGKVIFKTSTEMTIVCGRGLLVVTSLKKDGQAIDLAQMKFRMRFV